MLMANCNIYLSPITTIIIIYSRVPVARQLPILSASSSSTKGLTPHLLHCLTCPAANTHSLLLSLHMTSTHILVHTLPHTLPTLPTPHLSLLHTAGVGGGLDDWWHLPHCHTLHTSYYSGGSTTRCLPHRPTLPPPAHYTSCHASYAAFHLASLPSSHTLGPLQSAPGVLFVVYWACGVPSHFVGCVVVGGRLSGRPASPALPALPAPPATPAPPTSPLPACLPPPTMLPLPPTTSLMGPLQPLPG